MSSLVKNMIRSDVGSPFAAPSPAQMDEYKALQAKVNEEARANWDSEQWHREVAAVISSTLDYGFTFEQLFSSYLDVQTVGEFDVVEIRERRGLQVFYTARGGYIEETQLRNERWTLPRDTLGFHVSEFEDKLRANFAESLSELVGLAGQRMDAEVNRRLFALLDAALNEGESTANTTGTQWYTTAANYTKAVVDQAIREVRDAVKPNNGPAVPVTIISRSFGMDKTMDAIVGAAGYDPDATAGIRTSSNGYLGRYRGANLVVLENYTDADDKSYIPQNQVYVLGGTCGKFAMYGGTRTKSWDENTSDYRHYRGRRDFGGLVHHPEQARRIDIVG